ncbi:MAG TPA: N-acetylmuramoyl-L-alanine amidase, partial [Devosiaceae bacterium]|nr:N-acetylmuramoyl-L-alanine amidase [Devosiaceae bacterium]
HGGIDGGARADNGLLEKTVVLGFALELQEILIETGKFDVALTRDSDQFLTLEQRVTLARQNRADLMVSLHADSFEQGVVRGASIYTRDEQATDVLDKVLADQENRVDLLAGFTPPEADAAVIDILVDLMRRDSRRRAFRAASDIVAELERTVRMRRFPLRQADFFVLQAPEVPSILVELGFLSNLEDTTNLGDEAWRGRVAGALAKGIEAYFDAGR